MKAEPAPAAGWSLGLDLDTNQALRATRSRRNRLFIRIARAIAADIRRGRLAPDTRLPGSRALARSLAVHRNTVLAAYRELFAEGWIEARQGQGTYVSASLREAEPVAASQSIAGKTSPFPRRKWLPPPTAARVP